MDYSRLHIRIPTELKKEIEKIAAEERRTFTAQLCLMIEGYLKNV